MNYLEYDEPIFNMILLMLSFISFKYVDETISCRRTPLELTSSLSFIYTAIHDFTSASFGYDTECLYWTNFTKFVSLFIIITSLIFSINYVDFCLKNKYTFSDPTSRLALDISKKALTVLIINNYSSKLLSLFLNTEVGKTLYSVGLSSVLFISENTLNKINLIKYLPKTEYILTQLPSVRSRYILDKCYSLSSLTSKQC